MAGNLWEWSEEDSYYGGNTSSQYRMARGGGAYTSSIDYSACSRGGAGTTNTLTAFHIGFRTVLYMK